jgi:hypothetical protein
MKKIIHKWFGFHFWEKVTSVRRKCTICGLYQDFKSDKVTSIEYDSAYRPFNFERVIWSWEDVGYEKPEKPEEKINYYASIKGLKTKEDLKEFMAWFESEGQASFAQWMVARYNTTYEVNLNEKFEFKNATYLWLKDKPCKFTVKKDA